MMTIKNYFIFILSGILIFNHAQAKHIDPQSRILMTAQDIQTSKVSNIYLTNQTQAPITVSGVFIASFDAVTPFDVNPCSSCFGNIVGGDNLGGAVMSPLYFNANQTLPIGQNFLYNMLYNGIYYIKNSVGSSPCSLPGCSWPGDDPTMQGWCISINLVSLNSSYTYSNYTNGSNPPANAPAYGAAGNSPPYNYQYDLINPSTLGIGNACFGPITCNDQTLTCNVATAQTQVFESY